jgi:hypothetical protein
MLTWADVDECLDWAEDTGGTFDEMRSWHRARNGEDITKSEDEPVHAPSQQAREPYEPIVEPINCDSP